MTRGRGSGRRVIGSSNVKKIAMALGMVMVLAVACSNEKKIVIDELSDLHVHMNAGGEGGPPDAWLDFRGARHHPKVGSHCWSSGGITGCVETVRDVVVPRSYVEVPKGIHLLVQSDATSFTGLLGTVSGRGGEDDLREDDLHVIKNLEFEGGVAVIDVPPGEYTLRIEGEWDQGAVPFYFGIRVS